MALWKNQHIVLQQGYHMENFVRHVIINYSRLLTYVNVFDMCICRCRAVTMHQMLVTAGLQLRSQITIPTGKTYRFQEKQLNIAWRSYRYIGQPPSCHANCCICPYSRISAHVFLPIPSIAFCFLCSNRFLWKQLRTSRKAPCSGVV